MFIDRLHQYVFEENDRRRRDDRVALAGAVLISAVSLTFGLTVRTAALVGVVALAACVSCFVLRFCVSLESIRETRLRSRMESGPLYRPVSRRAALVVISGAAIVLVAPEASAAILDQRLKLLAGHVPLNRDSLQGIADGLDDAKRFRLKIRSKTLSDVMRSLQRTSEIVPALRRDAVGVGAKAAALSTMDIPVPGDMLGKPMTPQPEANGSEWTFLPIATNTGPDNYETIGMTKDGDVAEMWHLDTIQPQRTYGPAFLVVKGLDAALDGFFLKHVVFQDMTLVYHGGPVVLNEVYFIDCNFQFDSSVGSLSLLSSVVKGRWVVYANPPNLVESPRVGPPA